MSKFVNSCDFYKGMITYDFDKYCKDVVILDHHYTSDLVFLDKIRENAKKLGYMYERNLNTSDFEEDRRKNKYPPQYEKFSVFTKIDTEKTDEFPKEKIAVYRAFKYYAEINWYVTSVKDIYRIRLISNKEAEDVYNDYIKMFCGDVGFDYEETYAINPINSILIIIVDDVCDIPNILFPKEHKNFILVCLISTSSPHEIFIAPDLRANKDSDYQKKIEELKFLLGIKEIRNNQD